MTGSRPDASPAASSSLSRPGHSSDRCSDDLVGWETLDRRRALAGSPWLEVWLETVRLPDGRLVEDYYTLTQPDYVVVFAVASADRVVGLWRYKHGPRRVNLGLPAGYVEPGEAPLAAARRELLEETGYRAETWRHLGTFAVDGNRGMGRAHIYLARQLRAAAEPAPEDLEELRLELIGLEDLARHLEAGDVATLGAAAAVALGLNALSHATR
jgi:ADP-ribose pyrophosphatase